MTSKYGVYVGSYEAGRSIRSHEIAIHLDANDAEQAAMISSIERLERNGMRYSNEDCDVLGPAYRQAISNGAQF